MSLTLPLWRHFQDLSSHSEAASASACCSFSLGTLEVFCADPVTACFALTEQQHHGVWRWAIFGTDGGIRGAGCEPTQAQAKTVAEHALQLGAN